MNNPEFTIKAEPFSWDDNFSEVALEDFSKIQNGLPCVMSQNIGMALAKLKMLEEAVAKEKETGCARRICKHRLSGKLFDL